MLFFFFSSSVVLFSSSLLPLLFHLSLSSPSPQSLWPRSPASSLGSLTMSASTAAPQLRTTTAAAKSQSQSQTTDKSPRIPPPQQSIVEDHFYWTYSDEPHRSRRQAIIKAHPEVRSYTTDPCQLSIHTSITNEKPKKVTKLCGPEPITKYVVLGVVLVQITCAYLLRDTSMLSWKFLATAYLIGATANQNLFMAIHEISHNLAFKSPMGNRVLAMLANWPIGIPYSAAFRVCQAYT